MIKTNDTKIRREGLMQCDFGRVVFSLPGETRWRAISGKIHWLEELNNVQHRDEQFFEKTTPTLKQFVFREFAEDGLLGFIEGEYQENNHLELLVQSQDFVFTEQGLSEFQYDETLAKSDFITNVNRIVTEIQKKEFLKIVTAREEKAMIYSHELDWISTLKQLRNTFSNAMVFALKIGEKEIWLGCTPEQLLVCEQGQAKVHALAGTLTKNQAHSWTHKEQQEQQVTHDFVGDLLQKAGIQDFEVSAVAEVPMGDIKHLASEYTFPIAFSDLFKWVNQLHPTPAVGGWPQKKAWTWIDTQEGFDRAFYAGWLGYVDENQHVAKLFVTLRCGRFNVQGLSLFAGGGINIDSNAEIEWKETEAKMNVLKSAIVKL